MKVAIDVAGFNYSETDFTDEIISFYKLNPIQVFLIRSGQQISTGKVTIFRIG